MNDPEIQRIEKEVCEYGKSIGLIDAECSFDTLEETGWIVRCRAYLCNDDSDKAYSRQSVKFSHGIRPEDLKKYGIIGMEWLISLRSTFH